MLRGDVIEGVSAGLRMQMSMRAQTANYDVIGILTGVRLVKQRSTLATDSKELVTTNKQLTGRYVTPTVVGESALAFVPDPLPPRLTAKHLATLTDPLRGAGC